MPIGRKQSFCDLVWLARHGMVKTKKRSRMSRVLKRDGKQAGKQLLGLRIAGAVSRPFRYRGMQPMAWRWGRYFSSDNKVIVQLEGGRIWVHLNDGYWVKLVLPGYEYEAEVGALLRRLLDASNQTAFLDCGANIGYWSVVASSVLPKKRVFAVEASSHTFARLVENASLNADRFGLLQGALWSTNGEELQIGTSRRGHAGNSVVSADGTPTEFVRSVTIDSLVSQIFPEVDCRLIIKLDVEGAEIRALQGAVETIAGRNPLFIYEDHATDHEHLTTRFVFEELGYRVFWPGEAGTLTEIRSIHELTSIKQEAHRGYNFVAVGGTGPLLPLLIAASGTGRQR